jgi:hypothetical protein
MLADGGITSTLFNPRSAVLLSVRYLLAARKYTHPRANLNAFIVNNAGGSGRISSPILDFAARYPICLILLTRGVNSVSHPKQVTYSYALRIYTASVK